MNEYQVFIDGFKALAKISSDEDLKRLIERAKIPLKDAGLNETQKLLAGLANAELIARGCDDEDL